MEQFLLGLSNFCKSHGLAILPLNFLFIVTFIIVVMILFAKRKRTMAIAVIEVEK